MVYDLNEILQTIHMVESEHLDIRTLTMAISLRDTASESIDRMCTKIYDKITKRGEKFVDIVNMVSNKYGIPIVNKRVSVTPVALVAEAAGDSGNYAKIALAMDKAAAELGIDYIAGYSALVHKGMTPGDINLINSIPEALSTTKRVCSSVNIGSTQSRFEYGCSKNVR